MTSTQIIQKSIFYIFVQMLTLWSIFHQLTTETTGSLFETAGIVLLTIILFLYAYKTIKLLSRFESKEQHHKADLAL